MSCSTCEFEITPDGVVRKVWLDGFGLRNVKRATIVMDANDVAVLVLEIHIDEFTTTDIGEHR